MFLSRLQNLPLKKRKIILWLIVSLIALGLLFFWGRGFQNRIKDIQVEKFIEDLNFPDLKNGQ
jgi:uncharacterized membrane protein YvbJ